MKPLQYAIAISVVLASITMPALQAKADEDVRSTAYNQHRADGKVCAAAGPNCKFDNPYTDKPDDSGKTFESADPNTQALNNSDYIAGFIVGKSEANSK